MMLSGNQHWSEVWGVKLVGAVRADAKMPRDGSCVRYSGPRTLRPAGCLRVLGIVLDTLLRLGMSEEKSVLSAQGL